MTDFDDWLTKTFRETEGFTLLLVLVNIADGRVDILSSAHLHIIGDELAWPQMLSHLENSGAPWNAVAMFRAGREGLVIDEVAQERLAELMRALKGDRMLLREGDLFNGDGLRLELNPTEPEIPSL